jgi:DNA segregation ATPase FtsK/SpoIIIE-like protein
MIDIPIDDEPLPEEPIPDMPQGIVYTPGVKKETEKPRRRERQPETEEKFVSAADVNIPWIDSFDFLPGQSPEAVDVVLDNGLTEIKTPAEPVKTVKEKLSQKDVDAATHEITQAIEEAETLPEYQYPPVDLLRSGNGITSDGREEIALNRERLETTLHSFGIGAAVCDITRGPPSPAMIWSWRPA